MAYDIVDAKERMNKWSNETKKTLLYRLFLNLVEKAARKLSFSLKIVSYCLAFFLSKLMRI